MSFTASCKSACNASGPLPGAGTSHWVCLLPAAAALLFLTACASPPPPVAGLQEFTPRNCPAISDRAVILGRVSFSPSGAPDTVHPGLDLSVRDGPNAYVIRVHFGDLGDGRNSCLSFEECPHTSVLPVAYPVQTAAVRDLFTYLKARHYSVGKFTSWGVPWFHSPSRGSNCGDAFIEVVERLGIAAEVLPDMHVWIKNHRDWKWAFERGWRRPGDEFYRGAVVQPSSPRPSGQVLLTTIRSGS